MRWGSPHPNHSHRGERAGRQAPTSSGRRHQKIPKAHVEGTPKGFGEYIGEHGFRSHVLGQVDTACDEVAKVVRLAHDVLGFLEGNGVVRHVDRGLRVQAKGCGTGRDEADVDG